MVNEPLVKLQEDTILPDLPSEMQAQTWLIDFLAFTQKWGLILCIILILISIVQVKLFKIRKNPQLVRFWKFSAYGFAFIGIVFAVLPYIVFKFY